MLNERTLIIEAACAAWEAGNPRAVVADFADDVKFQVHAPRDASFVGAGSGRAELERRLAHYLSGIDVMYYEPLLPVTQLSDDILRCRTRFVYRHRTNSMEIDGTMRLLWRFSGDEIVRLEVFYDALRMRAFYDLIANVAV